MFETKRDIAFGNIRLPIYQFLSWKHFTHSETDIVDT